jgi:hypothetical protein
VRCLRHSRAVRSRGTRTRRVRLPLLVVAVMKLVMAGILKKAIGATIAFFVIIGFVLGFLIARVIYHRRP